MLRPSGHDAKMVRLDRVAEAFTPPEGQAPYDYVFDMTGETRHDRPDEVRFHPLTQFRQWR
jgi:hypothetical protein